MTEAKHTPGPWEWDKGDIGGDRSVPYCSVSARNGDLVIADVNFHFSSPEGLSNARLIAAAPDMLAVLQTILAENNTRGFLHPALDRKVDAAIAKATGAP